MREGISMSEPKLFAYLSYRDAPAALQWLTAIDFTIVRQQDGPGGTVQHAELRLGDVVIMVASFDQDYDRPRLMNRSTGGGLYLLVDNVVAIYKKAVEAGGTPVFEPEKTTWGTERARVLDPEGVEWSFGTYEPGVVW